MNLTQKESVYEEMMSEIKKYCADCKTTKTPLWRSGPGGPKSLCNACGIRYRKKRSDKEKKKEKPATNTSTSGSGGGGEIGKVGGLSEDLRVRLVALGKEVVILQRRQRSSMKRQRTSRKLGEEEQAAVLLMALSCDSVFA
ncbi:GATA transcription factor 16 [Actinidia rufa]|uniref:GATA transcription factor 16 n=1 Tax=Actinidia rufa TaxID=165716 RepID=A0A7J0FAJ3_9ERIC|nr:GATA transcription factor 16 [Actinidia rufa]